MTDKMRSGWKMMDNSAYSSIGKVTLEINRRLLFSKKLHSYVTGVIEKA